ncbi:MAG: zinc ribbon domain-containing protein [Candidatus Marinimicrobia bacterium]|nr:zinc ribbon domain-containing protein [Candidatus Neomarinimicrobiota bacterium]
MPIYEFKCNDCGNEFEELVSISQLNDNNISCPECGEKNVKKQISTPSIGGSQGSSCSSAPSGSGFT